MAGMSSYLEQLPVLLASFSESKEGEPVVGSDLARRLRRVIED